MIQLKMLEHRLLRYLGISLGCLIASCSINLFLGPAHLLTGGATDENRLEDPEHVRDVLLQANGAARSFVYTAPALSASILTLKKKAE